MKPAELLVIISTICALLYRGCVGQCPSMTNNWECTTDYCYKFTPLTYKNYADGMTYCSGVNSAATLPYFPTSAEFTNFNAIWTAASSSGRAAYLGALAWLGLDAPTTTTASRGASSSWTWNKTGAALAYATAWAAGYPIDVNTFDCAVTNSFTATWSNTLCSALLPTVCQIPYNSSYCSTNACQKCETGWTEGGNYCYLFDIAKNYNTSNMLTACGTVSASLPEFLTVADATAYAAVVPYALTFIGLEPVNANNYGNRLGWIWRGNNRIISYDSNWATNQPINDVYNCAAMTQADGKFVNIISCSTALPLACQKAANLTNCN